MDDVRMANLFKRLSTAFLDPREGVETVTEHLDASSPTNQ